MAEVLTCIKALEINIITFLRKYKYKDKNNE